MISSDRPIAILGAGPIGLEAALALAERALPFRVYEAASEVAAGVRSWGHVRLFSPWSLDVSPRMRWHLEAVGSDAPDDEDECPTGAELVERVLARVASLPGIAPHLRLATRVVAVARQGLLKNEEIASAARKARPFRLLLVDDAGREWTEEASLVLDCTGSLACPNTLGDGGIPAPGERACAARIDHCIPDLGREAASWASRRILLVGSGHSAQTAARDLAKLAGEAPGTSILWVMRAETPRWGPLGDDPLPERGKLAAAARALAEGASPHLVCRTGGVVDCMEAEPGGGVAVTLRLSSGGAGGEETFVADRVLALTGAVGDHQLYRQLQVHECYASGAPMKLGAALLGESSADCLAQTSHGPDTLTSPEPGFFILGAKSYGRTNTFLMRTGWRQVDDVLELLGR